MDKNNSKGVTSIDDMAFSLMDEEDNNSIILSSLNRIDYTISDVKNKVINNYNTLKQVQSFEDAILREICDLENFKKDCFEEEEKKLKKIRSLKEYKKNADSEIEGLKIRLRKKEEDNDKNVRLIQEYKKEISRLEKINQDLKAQQNNEIARILAWGSSDKANSNSQTDNDEINKAIAEYKKQNEMSKKQISDMEEQIKMLRYKLGNKTIPLSSLADGLKRYAKFYGLKEGKDLLMSLSYLLKRELVWADNVESLENFFIEAEKENKKPLLKLENNNGGIVQITETEQK